MKEAWFNIENRILFLTRFIAKFLPISVLLYLIYFYLSILPGSNI
jgi:hypothetical protein